MAPLRCYEGSCHEKGRIERPITGDVVVRTVFPNPIPGNHLNRRLYHENHEECFVVNCDDFGIVMNRNGLLLTEHFDGRFMFSITAMLNGQHCTQEPHSMQSDAL